MRAAILWVQVEIACAAVDRMPTRAVIWWASGAVTQLEPLGGDRSSANDINAEGEVVGNTTTSDGVQAAYFWSARRVCCRFLRARDGNRAESRSR